MRNKDIEKRLTKAISNSVPDVLDNILMTCEKKKGFDKNMNKKKEVIKDKFIIKPRLLTAAFAVMIFAFSLIGLTNYNNNFKVDSTIEFDVNPSLEIEVNKNEKIIGINALNEDGKKVLGDMDFKDVDLDIAVNAIIGSMLKNGFLTVDQNSILVSVKNDNKERGELLQKKLSEEIDGILKASKIEGSIITQEYKSNAEIQKIATNNNISEGKAELIKRILNEKLKDSKGNLYKEEDLVKLSINELKLLLEEKETTLKNVKTTGTASNSSYIGKDKAKEIALNNANIKEKDVYELEIELDADNGYLVYEVDFKSQKREYEYEINAKTGAIIKKEVEGNNDYYEGKKEQSTETNKETNNESNKETTTNQSTNFIGKEKAKQIAFKDAKVKANDVKELSVEFDKDNGIYHYEVEFKVNKKEYSYDINAKTGKIIDKEIDIDD